MNDRTAVYNQYLESLQKDVWIKNAHYKDDSFYSKHVRESLVHKFGEENALFEISDSDSAIGDGYTFGKKLLSEMNVTKEMAKKYANPETYKILEQGIFAPQHEQKQEQTRNIRR